MERKTNYEIIRIISMVLLVCFHCSISLIDKFGYGINMNSVALVPFENGRMGVDLFILLTGFFGLKVEKV